LRGVDIPPPTVLLMDKVLWHFMRKVVVSVVVSLDEVEF
jgi:hypothetical protein